CGRAPDKAPLVAARDDFRINLGRRSPLSAKCPLNRSADRLKTQLGDVGLLQLHRPVSVVEKCLPGLVLAVSELKVEERAASRFFGLSDQGHAGLFRSAAAFANIATHAGADDVVPGIVAALAARNDMIQAQLGSRILATAELTLIIVASKNVAAIELHRL